LNFDQTSQEWSLGGPLPKLFKLFVPLGCISRSQGQKIGSERAILKNLLVQNYKVQSFHIWYITSSRGPLPKLFNYAPGVKIEPAPRVTILHEIIKGKIQTTFSPNPLMGILPIETQQE